MEAELGLLIELAVQCLLVPHLHCFTERGTAENFSWHSHCPWSLLLTHAEAEAWLFLLGHATTAADLTLLNYEVFASGLSCHC